MKVLELALHFAPGLPGPITLSDLDAPVVLLHGPNASGKTTLGGVIGAALWPDRARDGVSAEVRFGEAGSDGAVVAHLSGGRVHWSDPSRAPSGPAGLASAWRLRLGELVSAGDGGDDALARRILTELHGGYDLEALGVDRSPNLSPHRTRHKDVREAKAALDDLTRAHAELAHEEAQLASLIAQQDEAAQANTRRTRVEQALDRLARRAELDRVQARLDALPDQALDVADDALEEAQGRLQEAQAARRAHREAQAAVAEAVADLEAARLPEPVPTAEALEALEARVEAARQAREHARRAREAAVSAEARVVEVGDQVWEGAEPPVDLPDRRALEALQTAAQAFAQAQAAHDAARRVLDGLPEPGEAPSGDPDALNRRVELLGRWLAAPRHELVPVSPPPMATWAGLVALGLILIVLALWLGALPGVVLGVLGGGLAGLGAGLVLAPRLLPTPPAPAREEDRIRELYTREGHAEPESWTEEAVEQALAQDRAARRTLSRERETWSVRREAVQRASRALDGAREDREQTHQALRAEIARWGLDRSWSGLSLAQQAARLTDLARARSAHAEDSAAAERAEAQATEALEAVRTGLSPYAGLDLPPVSDPTSARQAVRALRRRLDAHDAALEAHARAEAEAERAAGAWSQAEKAWADRAPRWGADPAVPEGDTPPPSLFGPLRSWLEARSEARELDDRRRTLAGRVADLEDALADHPALLADDEEALQAEADRLEAEAATLQDRASAIAAVRQRIADATGGRALIDAKGTLEDAARRLAEDRDHKQARAVDAGLLDWLQASHEVEDASDLLTRARRWLLAFTRHRYRLDVHPGGTFRARDTMQGLDLALSQLSDATRVQVLLAARLAWLERAEGGGPRLPLFLDEVLSTSDGARFDAIVDALLTLAEDGRQVLYATSSAAEVARWRARAEARGVSLKVASVGSDPVDWSGVAVPEGPAPVPSPEGRGPLDYARALGCARPTLHDPVDTWPLAVLLHDDLPAAAKAARHGLRTLGQLRVLPEAEADALLGAAADLARARGTVVEAAVQALSVGRGRPVDWEVVEASGAVSDTFADRVRALLPTHGGDPEAFVAAVGDLPRFHRAKRDELAEHLERTGHLDPREPLDRPAVEDRARVAAAPLATDDVLSLAEVPGLVALVTQVVGVEPPQP